MVEVGRASIPKHGFSKCFCELNLECDSHLRALGPIPYSISISSGYDNTLILLLWSLIVQGWKNTPSIWALTIEYRID
jgi:hypothetical protein